MMNPSLKRHLPALVLAATVAGGAVTSVAQTARRSVPKPPTPRSDFQADPDRSVRTSESRDLRDLIEELEQSSSADVRSGRIGRYFTNPADIITDGRVHRIDWDRIRDDRSVDRNRDDQIDRNQRDQDDRDQRDRNVRVDPQDRDVRALPADGDVRIESFQTRRIDARTMVVLYTAVIPGAEGLVRQPVVATLVRNSSSRPWRIATYTAENAAIPGDIDRSEEEGLRSPAK